ncbi:STAS and FHA domains-containing protein [Desulfonema limicola]|uniref:STAS and FHA domains-containing protein n=1 Tax=Desulfonema limicola TaxID=45656 RepID=A0A975BBC3_9BACT|nr:FHA domain-containing protein [Desulfonema limicola]QTA82519.1 STAS and FHA domains-containing protein [Desulfonema limicola]
MPSLKKFSLFESEITASNFNTTPYSISYDDILMEIDCENQKHIISANTEFVINGEKCYYSQIKTNDLISFNNEFIIFSQEYNRDENSPFIGKIKTDQGKIMVFKLPRKTSRRAYIDILKTIDDYPQEKNIYIECNSIQYMDSESISSMIDLIRKMEQEKRSIFFYNPGDKFNTYLKLANIMKLVPVKISENNSIDDFIKNRVSYGFKQSQNRYVVTDNFTNYIVEPETVISIGRLNKSCDICLTDERVSRIHALIVNTSNSLYVIDCLSTNFTYINGWKTPAYCLNKLKVNDIVVFGKNMHFKIKQI